MDDPTPQPISLTPVWSIPLLCVGLFTVALCTLLPQVLANQKLQVEREKLTNDLAYVQQQAAVNDEFLRRVGGDAALAERLAQRQMKQIRQGSAVLPLDGKPTTIEMSPFRLMSLSAPLPPTPYRLPHGFLGQLCGHPKIQLYLIGAALLVVAASLVAGDNAERAAKFD